MPLQYLLDTNICIYIAKQQPPQVLQKFQQLQVGEIAMSVITYGELRFGAAKSQQPDKSLTVLQQLTSLIPVLPMSITTGEHYGRIRAQLQQAGTMIGNNDLWIAAHALAQAITLVTHNTKEFKCINSLQVEDWVLQN